MYCVRCQVCAIKYEGQNGMGNPGTEELGPKSAEPKFPMCILALHPLLSARLATIVSWPARVSSWLVKTLPSWLKRPCPFKPIAPSNP